MVVIRRRGCEGWEMAELVPALGGGLWADSARFGEELAAAHALSGGEPKGVEIGRAHV